MSVQKTDAQMALDRLRYSISMYDGIDDDYETIRQALSAKQPEVVTVDKYTQHLLDERQAQRRYISSGEFISKRYPNGLIIKGE